jgi:hypothetical protein
MQKYIKILFRDKRIEPVYLSIEKWEGIVNDDKNLVAYKLDNETEWTGRVLNKAEVIYSEFDKEYSKKQSEPKTTFYRHIVKNTVVEMLEGQLPDDISEYVKL